MPTLLDTLIIGFDRALRTVAGPATAQRDLPAPELRGDALTSVEKHVSARLLRVDHSGEVCAQALYQGQALTARNPEVRRALARAAEEEIDHLAWCETRLEELGGATSALNPVWYAGSFALGALSGLLGDRWNLGFLLETERQVEGHLAGHLDRLPPGDRRSRAILEQMKADEAGHADTAYRAGAAELPLPIKRAMGIASQVMTRTSYWI